MIHAYSYDKGFKENRLTIWNKIQERTGKELSVLRDKPKCPDGMLYIWSLYTSIVNGSGDKITYRDIAAFNDADVKLSAFEIDLIFRVDLIRQKQ